MRSCWVTSLLAVVGCAEPDAPHEVPYACPSSEIDHPPRFVEVTALSRNTCAVTSTGDVYCWGDNSFLQLGYSDSQYVTVPKKMNIGCVKSLRLGANELHHFCALRKDGRVLDPSGPEPVEGVAGAIQIATYGQDIGALLEDGRAYFWGPTYWSDPGYNATKRPVQHKGLSSKVFALPTSGDPSCIITEDRRAMCWGRNHAGQLGNGTTISYSTPVEVVGLRDVEELAVGGDTRCARLGDGTVRCWGEGPLGDGQERDLMEYLSIPVKVLYIDDAVRVATTASPICAIRGSGEVWCWGICEGEGVCGLDSTAFLVQAPQRVPDVPPAIAITVGSGHACVLTEMHEVYCWGHNFAGQLGIGTRQDEPQPPQPVIWPWD